MEKLKEPYVSALASGVGASSSIEALPPSATITTDAILSIVAAGAAEGPCPFSEGEGTTI